MLAGSVKSRWVNNTSQNSDTESTLLLDWSHRWRPTNGGLLHDAGFIFHGRAVLCSAQS